MCSRFFSIINWTHRVVLLVNTLFLWVQLNHQFKSSQRHWKFVRSLTFDNLNQIGAKILDYQKKGSLSIGLDNLFQQVRCIKWVLFVIILLYLIIKKQKLKSIKIKLFKNYFFIAFLSWEKHKASAIANTCRKNKNYNKKAMTNTPLTSKGYNIIHYLISLFPNEGLVMIT